MIKNIRDAESAAKRSIIAERIENLRPQLEWVCDVLIPSDSDLGMPSAFDAGVIEKYLPRVLLGRDDLADAFFDDLRSLPSTKPVNAMGRLTELKEGFDRISRLIAGAFFLDENVNEKLGYPGQEEISADIDYEAIMSAIEAVLSRGTRYTIASDR